MPKVIISILIISVVVIAGLFFHLTSDDPSRYLLFGTWGTPNEIESFQSLIDYYNSTRNPKHKVKLFHPENVSYDERLVVQAAAGNLPDVIHLARTNLPSFVHKRLLEDLTSYIERDTSFRLNAFFPKLVEDCTEQGRLYGIPHNFSTLVLYYNKDHFDAEKISYPDTTWTWETLLDAAKRLTKRDAGGNVVRYGCFVQFVLFTMISQNGGNLLNSTFDRCVIASPEAVETFQFFIDLTEKHKVMWNYLASNLQFDDMFAGGRCSMIANGRWAAAWYAKSMAPGSMDIAPLPHGKYRVGAIATHMMTMSARSTKKDEAWEFIKFLVGEKAQTMVSDDGNNIPALRSVAESDLFLKNKNTPWLSNRIFLDELPYARDWPFVPSPYITNYAVTQLVGKAERDVILGYETSLTALQKMEDEFNRIIDSQKRVNEGKAFFGSIVFYFISVLVVAILLVGLRLRRTGHR